MSQGEFSNLLVPSDTGRDDQAGDMTEPATDELTMADSTAAEAPPHQCAQCAGAAAGDEQTDSPRPEGRSIALTSEPELASAVNALAQVALQMDDPVQALEDGVDALAEALVARQLAAQQESEREQLLHRRQEAGLADLREAYRHARLHRVGDLVDVGYSLDQATAITDANEAEIRRRSQAAGRDPNAVIYEYAIRHGYRPRLTQGSVRRPAAVSARRSVTTALERLASLSDDEFAEATRGDRWERLLKAK
ncbi:MAG TPA: hypothetical protein VG742_15910 [Dongiaceae bacterium]|nr:hypothetical protein [Dongiaceae bacterium]